jgi:putative FmdB family regulatory protein
MPIYEYRCRSCGQTMEAIQKMGAGPLRKCRSCSGRLDKLVSRSSFALKGGGWYSEGYAKNGKPAKACGDSAPKSAGSSAA